MFCLNSKSSRIIKIWHLKLINRASWNAASVSIWPSFTGRDGGKGYSLLVTKILKFEINGVRALGFQFFILQLHFNFPNKHSQLLFVAVSRIYY
jgi:hypothetical protein